MLTINRIAEPLSAVTVAVITGTDGPDVTHIPVGPDSGLTKYDESFVNCTDLQTIAKPRLRRRLDLLAPADLARVETAVRLIRAPALSRNGDRAGARERSGKPLCLVRGVRRIRDSNS